MSTAEKKYVEINKEICIGCGKCVKDCVGEKLYLANGKAEFKGSNCIQCGHCYAVCPVGAVKMANYDDFEGDAVVSMEEFDSDKLLAAMKSRRTVRQFKSEKVSREVIDKIVEAGRYCPTGVNSQDFAFTVITENLAEIEKEAVKLFHLAKKAATPFSGYIKNMTIDDKFFFKGAPLVIVVSGKGETSSCLASSYMELMAESLGLGVLYSGFFVGVAKINMKISSMLDLPKGHKPITCMVMGYPDVEYKRVPPRNAPKVKYM